MTTRQIPSLTQAQLLASMVVQLNSQSKEQAELQEQLKHVNQQLVKVHKVLAQKNNMIDSLEVDLEHMVEQLTRIKTTSNMNIAKSSPSSSKWINRTVPGVSIC